MRTQIILATILALSLASAFSISPSTINLPDSYPGQTIYYNISTDAEINQTLTFSLSLNESEISLEKSVFIVDETKNLTIGFIVNSLKPSYSFQIKAETSINETSNPSSSSSSSDSDSQFGGIIKKKAPSSIINQSQPNDTKIEPNPEPTEPEPKKSFNKPLAIIISAILVITGIIIAISIYNDIKKQNEDNQKNQEEENFQDGSD